MKILKNIAVYALVLALVISACGCDASATLNTDAAMRGSTAPAETGVGTQDFDAVMSETLTEIVNGDFATLYMSFEHPEALGIDGTALRLGAFTQDEWEEAIADSEATLARLEAVDETSLDPDDALTLDIVLDGLRRDAEARDYYYYVSSPLGVDGGPAVLSTIIAHSPYVDASSFEWAFSVYESLQSQFEEMVALEKERQELGYGLSQIEIDAVIDEYQKLIEGDPPAAVALLEEVIDKADFLSDTQKEELKERNEEVVRTYLVPAYEYLIQEMRSMEGRTGSVGLATMPDGAEYYAAALRSVGFDMTPEEILSYLKDKYDVYLAELSQLIQLADGAALEDALYGDGNPYWDVDSSQEAVALLQENVSQEFPAVGDFSYEVVETPEILKSPGVLAYYVPRPIDAAQGEASAIYINEDDDTVAYSTLAHEGFPGHMYQDAYEHAQDRAYARRYLENLYTASVEGWAMYAQTVAADFAGGDPLVARILALDEFLSYILYAYADIGVNYLGWDQEEMTRQLQQNMGVTADLSEIYDLVILRPAQFVPYAVGGAMILDMREKAENELGDSFSAPDFHRAILDVLPASMSAVQTAADKYIETVSEAPKLDSPLQAA